MIINYCDEMNLLSDDNKSLMDRACEIAFEHETGISEAPVEISVTVVDAEEIISAVRRFRGYSRRN